MVVEEDQQLLLAMAMVVVVVVRKSQTFSQPRLRVQQQWMWILTTRHQVTPYEGRRGNAPSTMLTVHHTYMHTESRAERRAGEYVATLAGYQPGCMVPDNDMTRQYKVHLLSAPNCPVPQQHFLTLRCVHPSCKYLIEQ